MEELINGKALYSPKGAALEYGRVGCNFYTGCYHDCSYCYLKRGAPSKVLGGTEVKLKKCFKDEKDAYEVFCKEVRKHLGILQKTGIFFSFTTDPMIPETIDLTISAMFFCDNYNIPVYILTKNADFIDYPRFIAFMNRFSQVKADIWFGFTLTGRDDMEPKASPNEARIRAMKKLKEYGFKTFASIEPVIDWYSCTRVIKDALPYCDHFKLGLRSGVKKDYYNIEDCVAAIINIVSQVYHYGKTIYLKESVRELLKRGMFQGAYDNILSMTVDADRNPICLPKE